MTAEEPGQVVRALRGVRTAGGETVDVPLDDARLVNECQPATDTPAGPAELRLPGWLALPSAVEPHAHLDKALRRGRVVASASVTQRTAIHEQRPEGP